MHERRGSIAGFWLSKRAGSSAWYRTWFDGTTRQTRRASLGTGNLAEAERRLAEFITKSVPISRADPVSVMLVHVFVRYNERHGRHTIGAASQRTSLLMMLRYLPEGITVGELTLDAQHEAVRLMQTAGYSAGTIKRAFGAARAAVNWAWNNQEIDRPMPFLRLPEGPGRERVLSVEELAMLWDTPMPEHLRMFLALAIGTAARPEAILQLTRFQCDLDHGVIHLNPPGRVQTKKRRPVLPMPDWLRPWIASASASHLVSYRGKPVRKIAGAFQTLRETAGFGPDVTAYTIRHTVATELARRGVPELEIAAVMGHRSPNRTTGRYMHVKPSYLAQAKAALDALATEIGRVTTTRPIHPITTPPRSSCVAVLQPSGRNPHSQAVDISGAGEGIRTLDPNLGKVMLYP